ncbi:MAG TPA: Nre family DNA repair protein [Thermoplasmataceae archaeon]|nr:Nre family DNA repair protein [Thermoplasmatales archaeon AK]HLH86572.1 Nre family DNA repair protein [Thermoplasmataceae archaeon]
MRKATLKIPPSLCLKCRGGKLLCGLTYCPIAVNLMTKSALKRTDRVRRISGSSPPTVFVGRYGYPKINVYPSSPPKSGDTSIYETSSRWLDLPLEEFLSMRLSLLRGSMPVEVGRAADPDYLFQTIQLMALSNKPVEVDIDLEKPLNVSEVLLDEHASPMGPSSPMKSLVADVEGIPKEIERVYYDTDFKAAPAMQDLYKRGIEVDKISRVLSIGALGEKKSRKIVPTRWSITAADKNISDFIVDQIKDFPTIDKFLAFKREVPGNLFMAILTPSNWIYEWGESWFPGSTWNQWGSQAEVEIDHEGYNGRTTYPDIGGCYYSTRLAVAEHFRRIGRSGGAITWREIYPSFNLPVGVWFVRENMRRLFLQKPAEFDSIDEALRYLEPNMKVPVRKWISGSYVYPTLRYNNLDRFFDLK